MSITITVPNDDHVALRAMAKALEEIAVARGASGQKPSVHQFIGQVSMASHVHVDKLLGKFKEPQIDTTTQQVESLSVRFATSEEPQKIDETATFAQIAAEVTPSDSTGTPWDERIHSASKALNSDGTWRVRRKPADKTPEEWAEYIKWVEEDIHLVESLRPEEDKYSADGLIVSVASASPGVDAYAVPEKDFTEVTGFAEPAGNDFHRDAGVVTEQEVAAIPAPPLPVPPVPVEESTAPLGTDYVHMTFPQVMQFLTERHGRITSAQVDQIIADMGLNSIMDLSTQPEHTGPFIARVKALLGE